MALMIFLLWASTLVLYDAPTPDVGEQATIIIAFALAMASTIREFREK